MTWRSASLCARARGAARGASSARTAAKVVRRASTGPWRAMDFASLPRSHSLVGRRRIYGGGGRSLTRLDEFEMELTADGCGGFGECVERDCVVLRIEQAIERGTAGVHAAGHVGLGELAV